MNLVLGDVVETIYVVDDDDDEKEDIKVSMHDTLILYPGQALSTPTDYHEKVRDAIR